MSAPAPAPLLIRWLHVLMLAFAVIGAAETMAAAGAWLRAGLGACR